MPNDKFKQLFLFKLSKWIIYRFTFTKNLFEIKDGILSYTSYCMTHIILQARMGSMANMTQQYHFYICTKWYPLISQYLIELLLQTKLPNNQLYDSKVTNLHLSLLILYMANIHTAKWRAICSFYNGILNQN